MSWRAWLSKDDVRDIRRRFPGIEEFAVWATRHSAYAGEIARLGVVVEPTPEVDHIGQVRQDFEPVEIVSVPKGNEAEFCNILRAELISGDTSTGAEDLHEDDQAGVEGFLGGDPYMRADYEAAGKLHKAGKMTVSGIEKRTGLKRKLAHRIWRQFDNGAVIYDDAGLHHGPGYRWDPTGREDDPPKYRLIRG